eukprot:gene11063-23429_t
MEQTGRVRNADGSKMCEWASREEFTIDKDKQMESFVPIWDMQPKGRWGAVLDFGKVKEWPVSSVEEGFGLAWEAYHG